MTLKDRVIRYILRRNTTTLLELEGVCVSKGFTIDELYATLDAVHSDKRIQYNANASGEITYRPAVTRTPSPATHLTWLRENYPTMDDTNDGSGIDVGDLSWLFLKTKKERDAFKAEMTGRPVGVVKSGHGKTNTWGLA